MDARSSRSPDNMLRSIPSSVRRGPSNRAHGIQPTQVSRNHASCLSHELRTPMHGVIGLLDIMQATLNDASIKPASNNSQGTFSALKRNIEAIQESSRRAIDAADNLVRAVELNSNMPLVSNACSSEEYQRTTQDELVNKLKRRSSEADGDALPLRKLRAVETAFASIEPSTRAVARSALLDNLKSLANTSENDVVKNYDIWNDENKAAASSSAETGLGVHLTNIRECIRDVIGETVGRYAKVESVQSTDWNRGQRIELRSEESNGEPKMKLITWDVELSVPDCIPVPSRDFAKIITCLLQNALKFTEEGRIDIKVQRSLVERFISIVVKDNGPGISPEFRSELFKPFSQEDSSTTRHKEGLGLGLLVAKGLAQKLQGDLVLQSADTEGANRGTEFSLRIPFTPRSQSSPSSPWGISMSLNPKRNAGIPFAYSPPEPTEVVDIRLPPAPASPMLARPLALASPVPSRPQINALSPSTIFSTGSADGYFPPVMSPPRSTPYQNHSALRTVESITDSNGEFAAKYPLNFMVVEDNVISRRLLVNMLKKLGYDAKTQIREASDGLEAVRLFQASVNGLLRGRRCSSAPPSYSSFESEGTKSPLDSAPDSPSAQSRPVDVILMDLWMPNLDGYEASKQIMQVSRDLGADSAPCAVPPPLILAVTADATQAAVDKAAQAGIEDLMLKPFRVKDLEKIVKESIVKREMQRGGWFTK